MTVEGNGAPGVQPAEGADAGNGAAPDDGQGAGLGLYDLSHLDAELRPLVEQELKKYEGNATKKFQEHAEYRKQWEPFEQIEGLSETDPEQLEALLQFGQLMADPNGAEILAQDEDFVDWWTQIGEQAGLFEGEPGGGEGGYDEGEGGQEPPEWASELTDRLDQLEQQLGPVSQSVSQAERDRQVQANNQEIEKTLAGLHEQHDVDGESAFDDDAVRALAHQYIDDEKLSLPEVIQRGFADLQRIQGQAQGNLVDKASDQPGAALGNGQSDTSPEEFSGLDDPALKQAARARFAGAR